MTRVGYIQHLDSHGKHTPCPFQVHLFFENRGNPSVGWELPIVGHNHGPQGSTGFFGK